MLHNIEGHGIGEVVLDIIIIATKIIITTTTKIITITTIIIIQSQIGSWVNWSWTSGRATEAQPPSPLISYQTLTTHRQPLFRIWEYLIILQCDCIIVVGNHCQFK